MKLLIVEDGEVEITVRIPREVAQKMDAIRKKNKLEYLDWFRNQSVFVQMALKWFITWLEDENFDPVKKIGDC